MDKPRKGARRIADIPPETLERINRGETETVSLVESLAVDFPTLLASAFPELGQGGLDRMRRAASLGWMDRMRLASRLVLEELGEDAIPRMRSHRSDVVRGWAAGAIAALPSATLAERLDLVRPLADDPNPMTRETAWLLLRERLAEDVETSVRLLAPWARAESANLRRYAVESMRPRGVWCKHIQLLKDWPEVGLPLLEPLKADPSRYVRDAVANWLNDASKTRPEWVMDVTERWLGESPGKEMASLVKRARRTLEKG